jgi:hypothetical protein
MFQRLALIESLRQEPHSQNLRTVKHLGKREFWELAIRNLQLHKNFPGALVVEALLM